MVQEMMEQGLGNMLSGDGGSGSNSESIQSMLSGLGGLNRDHELVRNVQQKAGIQDPETARQYTQQGVEVLNEQSKDDPQGLQSLLGGFLDGGGLGGMIGDVLGG